MILKEVIIVNEFNEFVREIFSEAGVIVIRSMMGGYLRVDSIGDSGKGIF